MSKPALVPKLRFPAFPEAEGGWTFPKLGSIGIFTGGGTPSKEKSNYWTGRNPWVSSSDISEDGIHDISISRFISDEAIQATATKVVPANSILLVSRVGVGKLAVSRTPICTSQDFTNFTPTKDDVVFLAYSIKSLKTKLLAFNQGMAIKGFTKDDVSNLGIPLPKLAEQQKIADCLSSLDELIAAQARKVDALKTHKKGLMQQLFPRQGETQPRLRFSEFQHAKAWAISELGSASDVRDGTHDSPKFFTSGRPLLTSKNLRTDGTLDLENVSLISEQDYEQINKRSKVNVGDILFGMIGTIGNPVLIQSEGFAIKNVALIKQLGPLLNSFLVQLLQSDYVAAIFAVLNTGNSQKFIALGKIRSLPVPIPALLEQQRIADCLTSLDTLITAATQELETLKTHKKGLMQQLFPSAEEVAA